MLNAEEKALLQLFLTEWNLGSYYKVLLVRLLIEVKHGNKQNARKVLNLNENFIPDDEMFEWLWLLFKKLLQVEAIASELANFESWFERGVAFLKTDNFDKLLIAFAAFGSNFNIIVDNIIVLAK